MTMPQNEQMTLEFVGLIASVILITGRNLGNHFRAQSGYLILLFLFPIPLPISFPLCGVSQATLNKETTLN